MKALALVKASPLGSGLTHDHADRIGGSGVHDQRSHPAAVRPVDSPDQGDADQVDRPQHGPRTVHRSPSITAHEEDSMSDRNTTKDAQGNRREPSGWVIGGVTFAAVMMMMAGTFQALAGIVAIFENEFYAATKNYVFQFDATVWGWIHLLIGLAVGLAGFGVLRGNLAARIVGIALAALSAVANFLFIPYYPFWSLAIIALDIFVIWALAAHGDEVRD
jgi:hypothetical protein